MPQNTVADAGPSMATDAAMADAGLPSADAAVDSSGSMEPSAAALLAKVQSCKGVPVKGGFGLDSAGSISIYACPGVLYWKADLDVDCDGIQSPPCNVDPQGQPQTSIKDLGGAGDVDPTS
jgi:hypothetical protein